MEMVYQKGDCVVKCEQPIDFVIPWIDGSDPKWIELKNQYLKASQQDIQMQMEPVDARSIRYRDWGTLHYWFRAVEAYAPWVNRIHLVVWDEVPDWMVQEHPKLNIVKHRDYMPEEYLPTFSANPIELNLHRISGLAEQFVYFNDDVYLTAPVKPTDFFVDGLPCDCIAESPCIYDNSQTFTYILLNDISFVNRHFSRQKVRRKHLVKWICSKSLISAIKNLVGFTVRSDQFFGFSNYHIHQSLLKSTLETVWELEPELLKETSNHRFRDWRDVNQYVFKYYQLLTGQFHPYNMRRNGRAYFDGEDMQKVKSAITRRKYKVICFNDSMQVDFETAKRALHEAFEQVLPEKSSFER